MRAVVIGVPTGWHVGRLATALGGRGHEVSIVAWEEISAGIDGGAERFGPAALDAAEMVAVRGMPAVGRPDARLENVVFRMDALARVADRGTVVVNQPRSLEVAIDKYLALARFAAVGIPVPRTRVVQSAAAALAAWEDLGGDCVLKPIFGSRGRGLERVTNRGALADLVAEGVGVDPGAGGGGPLYVQEFVPHGGWDVRVLTVGSRAFAMRRRAAGGDWRTNISRGGVPERFEPPADWVEMAFRAASAVGADIAGVDILPAADGRVVVLEVNAVPAWRGLEVATGCDIAAAIALYLEDRVMSRSRTG